MTLNREWKMSPDLLSLPVFAICGVKLDLATLASDHQKDALFARTENANLWYLRRGDSTQPNRQRGPFYCPAKGIKKVRPHGCLVMGF